MDQHPISNEVCDCLLIRDVSSKIPVALIDLAIKEKLDT